jgi:hypothetical protein
MMVAYNEISEEQWLKILHDYRFSLHKFMEKGCQPDQFKKLNSFKKGLDIVILRIQQSDINYSGVIRHVF